MSLISEALRKAKQEAAERGEPQRGMVVRTTVMMPSPRRGLGRGAALAAVAAALAAGALATWLLTRPGRDAGTKPQEVAAAGHDVARGAAPPGPNVVAPHAPPAETAPAAAPAPTVSAPSAPTLIVAPAASARAKAPSAPPPAISAPAAFATGSPDRAPAREGEPGPAKPTAPAPRAATEAAAAPPARERQAAERSFVATADLGGVKLTLDYIAFRSSGAFAGINGEKVSVGTVIEGVLVEEIGTDYVRLRDRRGPFYLRTH